MRTIRTLLTNFQGSGMTRPGLQLTRDINWYSINLVNTSVYGTVTASTLFAPESTIITAMTSTRADFMNVTSWTGTGCEFTGNEFKLTGDCWIEGNWGDNIYTASGTYKAIPSPYDDNRIIYMSTYGVVKEGGPIYGNEPIPDEYMRSSQITLRAIDPVTGTGWKTYTAGRSTVDIVDQDAIYDPYNKTVFSCDYMGMNYHGWQDSWRNLYWTAGSRTGSKTNLDMGYGYASQTFTNNTSRSYPPVLQALADNGINYVDVGGRWTCSGIMK